MSGRPFSKYHAIREGKYASRKEANRASELQLLAKVGAITDLREQVPFVLFPPNKPRYSRSLTYILDFQYRDVKTGVVHWEDVKGYETPVWRIKQRLMYEIHGIDVETV
jgi:hypothetical protein